jgi:hypothetical protein
MSSTLTYINEISVKLGTSLVALVAVVMTIVGANQEILCTPKVDYDA